MADYIRGMWDEAEAKTDRRTALVCAAAAALLTAIRYAGKGDAAGAFHGLGWWVLVTILCYLVLPALLVKAVLREDLSDWGLGLPRDFRDGRLVLGAFAVMVPVVLIASGLPAFRAAYPLHKPEGRGDLLSWEALYVLQFLAAEFFHRGFLVHGLKKRLGWDAIFVAMIPYCMIHFGKPLPETVGSIAAGIFLGVLSLRSGSILPGFALHAGAALLMDACVLWRG